MYTHTQKKYTRLLIIPLYSIFWMYTTFFKDHILRHINCKAYAHVDTSRSCDLSSMLTPLGHQDPIKCFRRSNLIYPPSWATETTSKHEQLSHFSTRGSGTWEHYLSSLGKQVNVLGRGQAIISLQCVKRHFPLADKLLPAVGNNFLLIMAGAWDPGKCWRTVRVSD